MKRFLVPAILIGLWLFAWATNTGLLVLSRTEPLDGPQRVCYYFIGFSVERVVRGEAFYAHRCPLLWGLQLH